MTKILVVDDMAIVRDPIAIVLNGAGYTTLCAGTGAEAIKLIRSELPDLVLLDIHLPDMSGLQILQMARSVPATSHIPVILLSSDERRDCILEAAKLGIQGYLIKSQFSLKELLSRISDQLSKDGGRTTQPNAANAADSGSRDKRVSISAVGSMAQVHPVRNDAEPTEGSLPVSAELLRSLKPIITREQVLEEVGRCAELKALSPTVAQLLTMTGAGDCSLDQITRVIKRDQAITLKVLKIANSVVYNRGEPVDTVQKAISRIGVTQIRQVVLNISVIDKFSVSGLSEHFNSHLFWEHSIATGLIAAAIIRSRQHDETQIETAFTMGLLHDVARMVFAEQLGDMYKRVLDTAGRLHLPLEQVETRMLLLNHADLMGRFLTAWKFPKALVEPIGLHHLSVGNIRSLAPRMMHEASTLALANRLAHGMLIGSSGNDTMYPTEEFVRILELKSQDIQRIEEQIPEQTSEIKYAMLRSGGSDWPDYSQLLLRQFQRPIRPLYVSAAPAFDAYRMLFERLRSPGNGGKPNVGIIHIANVSEREALTDLLLETEKKIGSDPLPLIIISQYASLKLESRILNGRMHQLLSSPFTLSRLVETVNKLLPPEDASVVGSDSPECRAA